MLLTDPYFAQNAREGVHLEDSLYAATYDAFKADRFSEVAGNTHVSATRFPLGANRDKFLFIGGLGKLNSGDANGCVADMKELVEKFPKSQLGEMAGMIINGVNAGRRLHGGKFDLGNVWDRRTEVLADSDSINAQKFSNERNTNFTFMMVYRPDSVNENQLLFQLARFNFSSYLVRDFDISIEDDGGLHRMKVSGFRNYDEALQYARSVYRQKSIVAALRKGRGIIISDINLPLLGRQFSYDDYDKFYAKHFAPLKVSTFMLLTEPDEIVTRPAKEEQPTQTDVDNMLEDGIYLDNGLTPNEPQQGTTIIEEPAQTDQPQTQGTTIIEQPTQDQPQNQGTTIIEQSTSQQSTGKTESSKSSEKKATNPQQPKQVTPVAPAQPKPTTPVKQQPQTNEDYILPDDEYPIESPETPKRQPTKQEDPAKKTEPVKKTEPAKKQEQPKKKDSYELEDEYYDLEGF